MSPQKQLFKTSYSLELLHIAEGDLLSARELQSVSTRGRKENIVYLAQQAVEKAVKAVLNYLRIAFPLVHEIGTLVALLPDEKMPPRGFDLARLNPYATVMRYEEPNIELTGEEIEESLLVAEEVVEWAKDLIAIKQK